MTWLFNLFSKNKNKSNFSIEKENNFEEMSIFSVEEKAYQLWIDAGKPECDGKKFWYEAEKTLNNKQGN
jgi:Protein of unknown function (DUF2934)